MRVNATAPCRIDLAGGTLDIHPIFVLLKEACTVNLAIDIVAEVEVVELPGSISEVELLDRNLSFKLDTENREPAPSGGELIAWIIEHFLSLGLGAVSIKTRSYSPPGAGLAASSALNVALTSALLKLQGKSLPPDELVRLCLDLEAKVLGTPTGYQDFYSAAKGGMQEIVFPPGGVAANRLEIDPAELAKRISLAYTGLPHHSGLNNWEVFKRFIDGDAVVMSAFEEIGYVAVQMAGALRSSDWNAVGRLLGKEWEQRKRLWPGVTTPEIDALILEAGKLDGAGKVCGAGGGGCVVLWHDGSEATRKTLGRRIAELGAKEVDWHPQVEGCLVTTSP